jgi:hypothetical protein
VRVSLRLDSRDALARLRQASAEIQAQARRVAQGALQDEAAALREEVRRHVDSRLSVARKSFLKAFTAKVLAQDPNRFPALHVGSRIPWSGLHETGGTISGMMLIPLYGRVGRKAFKVKVEALIRGGNAYFVKNAQGHVVLMAENIAEHDKPLAGFKRRYRKAEGIKRLKRGADLPIAVLVPKVMLRKRLDIESVVKDRLPKLSETVRTGILSIDS